MKKILTLILCVSLSLGCVGLVSCSSELENNEEYILVEENPTESEENSEDESDNSQGRKVFASNGGSIGHSISRTKGRHR